MHLLRCGAMDRAILLYAVLKLAKLSETCMLTAHARDQVAGRLFGVTVERADGRAPVWHPDVQFFALAKDGRPKAFFYLDPYSRPAGGLTIHLSAEQRTCICFWTTSQCLCQWASRLHACANKREQQHILKESEGPYCMQSSSSVWPRRQHPLAPVVWSALSCEEPRRRMHR